MKASPTTLQNAPARSAPLLLLLLLLVLVLLLLLVLVMLLLLMLALLLLMLVVLLRFPLWCTLPLLLLHIFICCCCFRCCCCDIHTISGSFLFMSLVSTLPFPPLLLLLLLFLLLLLLLQVRGWVQPPLRALCGGSSAYPSASAGCCGVNTRGERRERLRLQIFR